MFQICDIQAMRSTVIKSDEPLPHPTGQSPNISQGGQYERHLLIRATGCPEEEKVGFISDLWIDNYRKIVHSAITAHWITHNYTLQTRLMCCDPLDATQEKTGLDIKDANLKSFAVIDIDDTLSRMQFSQQTVTHSFCGVEFGLRQSCVKHNSTTHAGEGMSRICDRTSQVMQQSHTVCKQRFNPEPPA